MEEKIFYPVLRKDSEMKDIIKPLVDEEKELFARARKFLSKKELKELVSKMKKFKNTLNPKI